jgi:hypothetical protein
MGSIVIHVCGICNIHWPSTSINPIFPVHTRMQNHGTGHIRDGMDHSFFHTILMVSVHFTKMKKLLGLVNMRNTCVGIEDPAIC